MRKWILLLVFVMLVSLAYAIECENTWMANVPCNFTTPPLACTTYDLINTTGSLIVNDGPLTLLSGPIYYAQFNATNAGKNVIILCDNTTAVIDVQGYSMNTVNSNLSQIRGDTVTALANQATINQKLDDNFTKTYAMIESINVSANVTALLNYTADIKNRLGSGMLGNSTTLWDYMFCSASNFNSPTGCLFYRLWVTYPWRTTSGIRT